MARAQLATLGPATQLLELGTDHRQKFGFLVLFLWFAVPRERHKMLPTLVRRMARVPKTQIEAATNPTKLKKVWPPDFSKLTPQEQLRFEKRYKRRITHIAQRPKWTKMVKLAQYFTISCTNPELLDVLTC